MMPWRRRLRVTADRGRRRFHVGDAAIRKLYDERLARQKAKRD